MEKVLPNSKKRISFYLTYFVLDGKHLYLDVSDMFHKNQ